MFKKKINHKTALFIGIVHVFLTHNNTLITVTSIYGKTITFGSAGFLDFKGSKRGTIFASNGIIIFIGKKLLDIGIKFIQIRFKGFGNSRAFLLQSFLVLNLKIISVQDSMSIAHNGCRSKKKRRI